MSLKTNRTKKTKKPITRSSGQKRRTTQKAPHPSRTRGGDVIGSGGFGCVFRPALKCSRKKQRVHGMVSKLMTRRHTKREYSTIKGIKQRLRDIPQYTDYLLIDKVSTCTPAPLTDSDLSNFDKKCKMNLYPMRRSAFTFCCVLEAKHIISNRMIPNDQISAFCAS